MNRLIVCLKKPCQVWALALAASLAFFACSNGNEVAGGVTDIGDYAFSLCKGLTDVALPDSVSSVGANPFRYCDQLTEIR